MAATPESTTPLAGHSSGSSNVVVFKTPQRASVPWDLQRHPPHVLGLGFYAAG